jgi:glycerol uptake facilitator-like aquaporin
VSCSFVTHLLGGHALTRAEKSNLTPFAPLAFGMTLFVVMLFSIAFTGGAVK